MTDYQIFDLILKTTTLIFVVLTYNCKKKQTDLESKVYFLNKTLIEMQTK